MVGTPVSWAGGRTWVAVLGMAAAYYVVGSLSLLLAIPPGYATAVWPAAGIALAGTLVLGNRVWPGIILGSLAVNVWTSLDATSLRAVATSGAVAASIGLGAALQALLGASLVRRFVGYPTLFLRDPEVLKFLLLGGPVACLMNAVWGVTTLLVAGLIEPSDYVFHWWTWWVGDSIGVVTVAPLVLIWFTEAGQVTPRRRAAITIPTAMAFALVVVFFVLAAAWERDRLRLEFGRQTDTLVQTLERGLKGDIEVLYSVESLFVSSTEVDRAGFRTFVTGLLARHPGLQALSWNPRIRAPEREAYELRARRDGLADFRITERDAQGGVVVASPRREYVAVYYIEPLAGNEPALGFDVASDPVRRAAMDRARETGEATATEPIVLVQDTGRRVGFLAYLPIHGSRRTSSEGDREVLGYVTGVFRVGDMVAMALQGGGTDGVSMQVYDVTTSSRQPLLDGGPPEGAESIDVPSRVIPLQFAGRRWEVHFVRTHEYLAAHRSWQSWGVLAVGMLFNGLLGASLLMITGRAGQLQAANAELQSQIAERVRAERALNEAEERAALIVAEALDAVITIDLDGLVTSWNPQAEHLFGWTEGEILGRRLAETIIPPEHREAHERGLARFRQTGEGPILGRRLELTAQRRDGTTFPIELAITRVMIRGRVAFSAFVRDISERKRAAASLERYAKRLNILHTIDRALIAGEGPEEIAAGVLTQVRELLEAPRVMVILFDLAAGEAEWLAAMGRRRLRLGGGVRYSLDLAGDLEALRRGEPQVVDVSTLPDSPEARALLDAGIHHYIVLPMHVGSELVGGLSIGGPVGAFAPEQVHIGQEVAAQIGIAIAQARLRATKEVSENRFRALVEGSIQGMYAIGSDLRIRYANAAMATMFGFQSPDEVVDRSILDLYAPEDHETIEQRARARFRGEAVSNRYEVQGVRTDGMPIWLDLLLSQIVVGGEPQTQVALVDITERKRAEEQFRQAQKMEAVGLLAGGIAHDFNNLLTVIGGRSTLLMQRGGLSEATQRDAELISKTAQRAAALTRQLLAFSRKQVLEPKPIDLNALVEGVAPMLRRLIGEHIELATVPGTGLGHVMADPGHIEQVVMNLIVNARDAMTDGGTVTIETASRPLPDGAHHAQGQVPPGRYVTMSVQDSGCGMDPVTLNRIFEPFFTTKDPGKGTGLGLSTVHGIVHQSGGHIGVDSAVGRGTTFTIYLPEITGAVAAPDTQAGSPSEPARGTETVLLVEDDEELRELASEILTSSGYRVLETGDPLEAITIAERHAGAIDLLVTDMVLPAMRGSELAQRLESVCRGLRVLYMSGYTDEVLTAPRADEPARVFLQKPFTPHDLARKAREALAKPERA